MTQTEINFAKALYELEIPREKINEARLVLTENPCLYEALSDNVIPVSKKHRIIDEIFDGEVKNFLKLLCDRNIFCKAEGIFAAYESYCNRMNNILEAVLVCVTPPSEEQTEKIKEFLMRKHNAACVKLDIRQDSSLIGGFIIHADGREYDRSIRGNLLNMRRELIGR